MNETASDYDKSHQRRDREIDAGTTGYSRQNGPRTIPTATRTTRTSRRRMRPYFPRHRHTRRLFCSISLYSTSTRRIPCPPPASPIPCGYARCFSSLYRTTPTVCRDIGVLLFGSKPDQRCPPKNGRSRETRNGGVATEVKHASRSHTGSFPLAICQEKTLPKITVSAKTREHSATIRRP